MHDSITALNANTLALTLLRDQARSKRRASQAARCFHTARYARRRAVSRRPVAPMDQKRYLPIEIDEQVELLSFIGNVTSYTDEPRLHAHCVVGHRDGHTTGGHLLAATVRPTFELMVYELPLRIARVDRPEVGIPLIDLSSG
jgi:hypothetical protein